LWRQLTLRTNYVFSKTTDNTSEIFSSYAAGNTYDHAQNPLDFTSGEHRLSGLDFRHHWSIAFVEEIPFFRSQKGVLGHILGGWGVSGTSILSSGQPFTPVQLFLNTFSGGSVFDTNYDLAFIGSLETARPFLANPNAPPNSVGIFAGDACAFAGVGCSLATNTLLDFAAVNTTGTATTVTQDKVHFIANGGTTADTIFGTPFGTAARNSLRDYKTVTANFQVFKSFKFGERATLRWHMSMLNVFNHPYFSSIDPFIEDAGLAREFTGFANPRLFSGGNRSIIFGLKILF
jgi:hypothetical protein